jgi:hypothetical protein
LLPVEEIRGVRVALRIRGVIGGLVFRTAAPAAKVIEANVRYDAIHPRIETALEAEAVQILIDLNKRFLVDVSGIFGPVQDIHGDSQDVPVIPVDQFLERFAVTALRAFDQNAVIGSGQGSPRSYGCDRPLCSVAGTVQRPCDRHAVG